MKGDPVYVGIATTLRKTLINMSNFANWENISLVKYFGNVAIKVRPREDIRNMLDWGCRDLKDVYVYSAVSGELIEFPACEESRKSKVEIVEVWIDDIAKLSLTVFADNWDQIAECYSDEDNKPTLISALTLAGLIEFQLQNQEFLDRFDEFADDAYERLKYNQEIGYEAFVSMLILLLKGWKYGDRLFRWGLTKPLPKVKKEDADTNDQVETMFASFRLKRDKEVNIPSC